MLGYQSRVHPLSMTHDQLFSGERGSRIPYHRMYGKEYCLPSLIVFSEEEAQKLREASEQVDRIYKKVLVFVQRELPDLLLIKLLGLEPELIPAARIEVPFHGVSRQDWIVTGEGIKCIENNTDTPTGIPETAYLSDSILHNSSYYENPSKGMDDAIQFALIQLIEHYQGQGLTGDIVFSSYGEHIEDYTNTHYLLDRVRETGLNARFASLDEIELVAGQGIYHQGSKIDIWYRLYPLEYLVHDHDDEGRPIGREVLHLIEEGKLGLINPVQSIITQSKGFMALIWSLYENNQELFLDEERPFFSEEEMSGIRTYLLPTYVSSEPFKQSHCSYVSKGYWVGREKERHSIIKGDSRS